MSADDHGFSAKRIFITLFILTAVEVAWGYAIPYENKMLLWGGLLAMAFWKGLLIFMYFMHMKFEGWIVKVLIAPTVPLIFVVIFSLMPDVAKNKRTLYNVADQLNEQSGEIIEIGNSFEGAAHAPEGAGGHGHGDDHGGGH